MSEDAQGCRFMHLPLNAVWSPFVYLDSAGVLVIRCHFQACSKQNSDAFCVNQHAHRIIYTYFICWAKYQQHHTSCIFQIRMSNPLLSIRNLFVAYCHFLAYRGRFYTLLSRIRTSSSLRIRNFLPGCKSSLRRMITLYAVNREYVL